MNVSENEVHMGVLPFLKGIFQIRDLWQKKGMAKRMLIFRRHSVAQCRVAETKPDTLGKP